jgi:hypothetical protein
MEMQQPEEGAKGRPKEKPKGGIKPDPILAVIERHKAAHGLWVQVQDEANAAGSEDHERKSALAERQWHAVADATRELFVTTPASIDGLLALLQYIADREAAGDELLSLDSLPPPYSRASVALCHRAIEVLGPHDPGK